MLIDVILILILVMCALSGYRKGLLMSLLGLLVIVLCCLGATAARNALTPRAAAYLEPRLAGYLQSNLESGLQENASEALEGGTETGLTVGGRQITFADLAELLRQFGLDVEETVSEAADGTISYAAEAAARALARALTEQIAGAVIFFAAFIILYLLLHSAALALNMVDRVPVVHTFNRMGGLLLNLCGGLLAMIVATAVFRQAELLPVEPGPFSLLLIDLSRQLL